MMEQAPPSSRTLARKATPEFFRQQVVSSAIHSLPGREYDLMTPLPIVLEYDQDEVIASIPELEVFADGPTAEAAIAELKLEVLDLADMLFTMDDELLGVAPRTWKKALAKVIRKCP
jgi:hypothetical protein